MYDFFCGKLLFGEEYDDPMDIYKDVNKEELKFPPYAHDKEFIDLEIKMLKKSRLWQFEQIKEEPYFIKFDWNKLISLPLTPPYKLTFKNEKENVSIPYLAYLNEQDINKINNKKKLSVRGTEFEKGVKNF